jgi:hypothetical protein
MNNLVVTKQCIRDKLIIHGPCKVDFLLAILGLAYTRENLEMVAKHLADLKAIKEVVQEGKVFMSGVTLR